MSEYRVKVTIKNNLLASAIEAAGYKNQAEFARAADITAGAVGDLIGLRCAPIGINGEFSIVAKRVMEVLGAAPSDLWTDQQLYMNLPRSSAWREVSEETLQAIADQHSDAMALPSPDDLAEASEVKALVSDLLSSLSPREEKVMRLLYEEDKTLVEVAAVFELSIERIRQIRIKAEKKMRNPIRSNHLVRGMVIDGEITNYDHFGNYKEVPLISRAKRNAQ